MKWFDNLRLVVGFLPEIDLLPETAQKARLLKRVAVVLNLDEIPYSQFYWELFEAFAADSLHDSVAFEIDSERSPPVFASLAALREYVERPPKQFGVPFSRAVFSLQGKATAFINTEPWATVGGPAPYHDSWTFSIYRETDDVTSLRDDCCRLCARYGLPVLEEMQGLPAPQPAPLWKRLAKWLLS